jgi:flagellar biosynthesis/type III secretory pathway protein FliH
MEPTPFSSLIVRGDILRAHKDARTVLAEAEAEATRVRARLDAERHNILQEARRVGLLQGLSEAAGVVANAAEAVDAFWREREGELAEVALAIAHRVVASLPSDDLLVRLALDAIAEHGATVQLTFRTTPEAAVCLRTALSHLEHGDRVTILADPNATPGECTLVHPRGRTELGLLAQFRAMMNGLSGQKPSETELHG